MSRGPSQLPISQRQGTAEAEHGSPCTPLLRGRRGGSGGIAPRAGLRTGISQVPSEPQLPLCKMEAKAVPTPEAFMRRELSPGPSGCSPGDAGSPGTRGPAANPCGASPRHQVSPRCYISPVLKTLQLAVIKEEEPEVRWPQAGSWVPPYLLTGTRLPRPWLLRM